MYEKYIDLRYILTFKNFVSLFLKIHISNPTSNSIKISIEFFFNDLIIYFNYICFF